MLQFQGWVFFFSMQHNIFSPSSKISFFAGNKQNIMNLILHCGDGAVRAFHFSFAGMWYPSYPLVPHWNRSWRSSPPPQPPLPPLPSLSPPPPLPLSPSPSPPPLYVRRPASSTALAASSSEPRVKERRRKTAFCVLVRFGEQCPYGSDCSYAHSIKELQPLGWEGDTPLLSSSVGDVYKTRMCQQSLQGEVCPYGMACLYAHSRKELQTPEQAQAFAIRARTAVEWTHLLETSEPVPVSMHVPMRTPAAAAAAAAAADFAQTWLRTDEADMPLCLRSVPIPEATAAPAAPTTATATPIIHEIVMQRETLLFPAPFLCAPVWFQPYAYAALRTDCASESSASTVLASVRRPWPRQSAVPCPRTRPI